MCLFLKIYLQSFLLVVLGFFLEGVLLSSSFSGVVFMGYPYKYCQRNLTVNSLCFMMMFLGVIFFGKLWCCSLNAHGLLHGLNPNTTNTPRLNIILVFLVCLQVQHCVVNAKKKWLYIYANDLKFPKPWFT